MVLWEKFPGWLFWFDLCKRKRKLAWQNKKRKTSLLKVDLIVPFYSPLWIKKIRNKAFPFKYPCICLLPSFFVLVNVACKMTMSREYQMEMMERWAQEWPAGPIHTCSHSGMQTRLHTHPTPSSCQARKKRLAPVFTQWEQKSCKDLEDKRVCGKGYFRKCSICWKGKGKGGWTRLHDAFAHVDD